MKHDLALRLETFFLFTTGVSLLRAFWYDLKFSDIQCFSCLKHQIQENENNSLFKKHGCGLYVIYEMT